VNGCRENVWDVGGFLVGLPMVMRGVHVRAKGRLVLYASLLLYLSISKIFVALTYGLEYVRKGYHLPIVCV
jgi:hypothetical protein